MIFYDFKLHWALILICMITGYVLISAFTSLAGITIDITSPPIGIKIYVIIVLIEKKNESILNTERNTIK